MALATPAASIQPQKALDLGRFLQALEIALSDEFVALIPSHTMMVGILMRIMTVYYE